MMTDIPTLSRWSSWAGMLLPIIALSAAGLSIITGAYLWADPYVPVLKSQVFEIVDSRNTKQTAELQKSIGGPVLEMQSNIQTLLRRDLINRCNQERDRYLQLDGRLFDLERLLAEAFVPAMKLDIERRIRTLKIELSLAD